MAALNPQQHDSVYQHLSNVIKKITAFFKRQHQPVYQNVSSVDAKKATVNETISHTVYQSHCWNCGSNISSDSCACCPICGWYYCRLCGACKKDSSRSALNCIDELRTFPEEKVASRADFRREHLATGISPREWLDALDARKKEKEAECDRKLAEAEAEKKEAAVRRWEENQRKLAEKQAAERLEKKREEERRMKEISTLREKVPVGASVYSTKYGTCSVASFKKSANGNFEYISISTPEGTKDFVFPDCFERGFLKLEYPDSNTMHDGIIDNDAQDCQIGHLATPFTVGDISGAAAARALAGHLATPFTVGDIWMLEALVADRKSGPEVDRELAELFQAYPEARNKRIPYEVINTAIFSKKTLLQAYVDWKLKQASCAGQVPASREGVGD